MIRARVKSASLRPEVAAFALRLPSAREMLINLANTATITNISQDGLSRATVPVPPIALQNQFADAVTRIEALRQKQTLALAEQEALFASLQARLFIRSE